MSKNSSKSKPETIEETLAKLYAEYKRLKGTRSKEDFEKVSRIFVDYTQEIYVSGYSDKFETRGEAYSAFIRDGVQGDFKEGRRIFETHDNLYDWT